MLNSIGAARAADTLIFELSTEHFIRAAIAGLLGKVKAKQEIKYE